MRLFLRHIRSWQFNQSFLLVLMLFFLLLVDRIWLALGRQKIMCSLNLSIIFSATLTLRWLILLHIYFDGQLSINLYCVSLLSTVKSVILPTLKRTSHINKWIILSCSPRTRDLFLIVYCMHVLSFRFNILATWRRTKQLCGWELRSIKIWAWF